MSERRPTYRFGPLERRGLLGPVARGQAAMLGARRSLLAIVRARPRAVGGRRAAGAASCALAAAPLAFAPLGGRTPSNGLPVALAFGVRRASAPADRFRSPRPTAGTLRRRRGPAQRRRPRSPARRAPAAAARRADRPSSTYRERTIGALAERRGRRLTAVLACRVLAFSLLDPEAQERRLARWGLVLSGAAGTAVRRIQWIERTAPAQGDELARWLHAERDPAVPLRGTPMIESYLELIGEHRRVTQEHEILRRRPGRRARGCATAAPTPCAEALSRRPSGSPRGSRRPR